MTMKTIWEYPIYVNDSCLITSIKNKVRMFDIEEGTFILPLNSSEGIIEDLTEILLKHYKKHGINTIEDICKRIDLTDKKSLSEYYQYCYQDKKQL